MTLFIIFLLAVLVIFAVTPSLVRVLGITASLAICCFVFVQALPVQAQSVGAVANPAIDQLQAPIAAWIAELAASAFLAAATWLGGIIGWRFVEKLNRATIKEAAERYANGLIDLAQARYLDANPSAIGDYVSAGIDYIKSGNAGTVRQSKITDDRIGAYVTEAIQNARADRLSSALDRALARKNASDTAGA